MNWTGASQCFICKLTALKEFARWYVDDTERHPTFQPVADGDLPGLIAERAGADRQRLMAVVEQRFSAGNAARSPTDAYCQGWVRLGDINVVMRLRDWRPNGEVLAPWGLRQQMGQEASQEVGHYR